jgi:methylthioxylose transferase
LVAVDRRLSADLVAAGGAALLVTAAAVVGARLLDERVPLHVAAPPLGARWLPHTGLGTVPAMLIALLVLMRGPELAARLPWRPLLALSAVTSVAWTISLALIDGWQLGVVGRLTTPTEYLHDVPRVARRCFFLTGWCWPPCCRWPSRLPRVGLVRCWPLVPR